MKYLNTNGASSYDSDRTRQVLKIATKMFEQVASVLIALREEMAKHGVALSDGDNGMKAQPYS
mgnify:CR=1 FL=1